MLAGAAALAVTAGSAVWAPLAASATPWTAPGAAFADLHLGSSGASRVYGAPKITAGGKVPCKASGASFSATAALSADSAGNGVLSLSGQSGGEQAYQVELLGLGSLELAYTRHTVSEGVASTYVSVMDGYGPRFTGSITANYTGNGLVCQVVWPQTLTLGGSGLTLAPTPAQLAVAQSCDLASAGLASADQLADQDVASLGSSGGVSVSFPAAVPGTLDAVADLEGAGGGGVPIIARWPGAAGPSHASAPVALQARQAYNKAGLAKVRLALTPAGRHALAALAKAHHGAKLAVTFSFQPSAAGAKAMIATGTAALPATAPAPVLIAGLGAATFTKVASAQVGLPLAPAERAALRRAAALHHGASFDVFLLYQAADATTEVVEERVTLGAHPGPKAQLSPLSAARLPAAGSCAASALPTTTTAQQSAEEALLAAQLSAGLSAIAADTPAELAADPTLSFAGACFDGASAPCPVPGVEEAGALANAGEAPGAPTIDTDAIGAAATLAELESGGGAVPILHPPVPLPNTGTVIDPTDTTAPDLAPPTPPTGFDLADLEGSSGGGVPI